MFLRILLQIKLEIGLRLGKNGFNTRLAGFLLSKQCRFGTVVWNGFNNISRLGF